MSNSEFHNEMKLIRQLDEPVRAQWYMPCPICDETIISCGFMHQDGERYKIWMCYDCEGIAGCAEGIGEDCYILSWHTITSRTLRAIREVMYKDKQGNILHGDERDSDWSEWRNYIE